MVDQVDRGWYPDPYQEGQARYWSGDDWTDRTRPSAAPNPADDRETPPWPVVALGALSAVALGVMVSLLLTRGDDGSGDVIEAAPVATVLDTTTTTAPTATTAAAPTTTVPSSAASGPIDQWIAVLASVEQSLSSGEVASRHGAIQGQFPDAEQLDSSDYPSLRPGYFVSYVGPFDSGEAAVSFCRSNGLSVPQACYGRYLSNDPADQSLIADS